MTRSASKAAHFDRLGAKYDLDDGKGRIRTTSLAKTLSKNQASALRKGRTRRMKSSNSRQVNRANIENPRILEHKVVPDTLIAPHDATGDVSPGFLSPPSNREN